MLIFVFFKEIRFLEKKVNDLRVYFSFIRTSKIQPDASWMKKDKMHEKSNS